MTGLSADKGSWKMIPISPPLISLSLSSEAFVISSPFSLILPSTTSPAFGSNFRAE